MNGDIEDSKLRFFDTIAPKKLKFGIMFDSGSGGLLRKIKKKKILVLIKIKQIKFQSRIFKRKSNFYIRIHELCNIDSY